MKKIALVILLVAAPALAHDHERPELDSWFLSLRSPGGGPCCDASEAKHLDEPDWENNHGHYRVIIDGKWVDVPDDKVIRAPNKAGYALEWHYYLQGEPIVRCFMPGVEM